MLLEILPDMFMMQTEARLFLLVSEGRLYRCSQSTDRFCLLMSGQGVRTEYIYNGAGAVLLTKVMDKNGQNIQYTRNIHDALGRIICCRSLVLVFCICHLFQKQRHCIFILVEFFFCLSSVFIIHMIHGDVP